MPAGSPAGPAVLAARVKDWAAAARDFGHGALWHVQYVGTADRIVREPVPFHLDAGGMTVSLVTCSCAKALDLNSFG